MKTPYLERYPDVPITLDEQLERCGREYGHRTAIVDQSVRLTWQEVLRMVNVTAADLIDRNVQAGDRVFIAMERRWEIVIAYLAVARVRAIAVPLNFKSTRAEQEALTAFVKPSALLLHHDIASSISTDADGAVRLILDDDNVRIRLHHAASNAEADRTGTWPSCQPDDLVYLNLTSGSTGQPKAAMATHRILYGNTAACVRHFDLSENDVHLPLFAVMSHPHEIFCRALFTGACIALVENLYPRTIAETIHHHRVTCIMAVAGVYSLLLPFIASGKYDISSVRLPESGGMSTPPALEAKFKELCGVPIIPVWGSTETMGIAFSTHLDGSSPSGSVGTLLPGYQARIVDRHFHSLPSGEIGELLIRGTGVTSGYWQDSPLTESAFHNGWYRTGDLFEEDTLGNFFFRGRMDAMIKAGGFKIYPAEIEAALFTHPLIREAVVVPFDDRLRGLVPMAVLVIEPGESLTESQLRHYLSSRLSRNKIPRIFRFLPDLPRTASGKVDRKALLSFGSLDHEPSEISLERRLEAIDLKILHLLNERMRIEIQLMKVQHESAFQPERIQDTIQRILEFNPGPLHDSIVEQLFRTILSLRNLY
ncbi:AMP-binding protein [bacterium]|nr:AMP-binding protein [candidate division CSSED10-310 bacterium]